ncbi:hypothetical protein QF035_004070 [Streptomyces umbrinus]|uniref:Uncharacterized protein n=1 Tax=Streptomyces umbrinus TaxID=67370 RepID=A0ABU0SSG1_9ACTN|nr:hypothetical protein [Streptomyces umbrinus]
MATNKFLGYLESRKNLTGSACGIVGLALTFAGVAGPYWPVVVVGLYGAGALVAPPERPPLPDFPDPSAQLDELRGDFAKLRAYLTDIELPTGRGRPPDRTDGPPGRPTGPRLGRRGPRPGPGGGARRVPGCTAGHPGGGRHVRTDEVVDASGTGHGTAGTAPGAPALRTPRRGPVPGNNPPRSGSPPPGIPHPLFGGPLVGLFSPPPPSLTQGLRPRTPKRLRSSPHP